MTEYDVIIVGAGPAGMFATYELLTKSPKLKIALIDIGDKVKERSPKDVMSGIGGAGTFSDGKLHFTAVLSHEKAMHLTKRSTYQKVLDYVDEIFTKFGVDSEYYPKENEQLDRLVEEAVINDIELVVRKARHVGTDKLKDVILEFEKYLEKQGVDILDNTEVTDIIIEKGKAKGVKTKKGKEILADHILLAPGRVRARWLQDLAKKLDIDFAYAIEFSTGFVRFTSQSRAKLEFLDKWPELECPFTHTYPS